MSPGPHRGGGSSSWLAASPASTPTCSSRNSPPAVTLASHSDSLASGSASRNACVPASPSPASSIEPHTMPQVLDGGAVGVEDDGLPLAAGELVVEDGAQPGGVVQGAVVADADAQQPLPQLVHRPGQQQLALGEEGGVADDALDLGDGVAG